MRSELSVPPSAGPVGLLLSYGAQLVEMARRFLLLGAAQFLPRGSVVQLFAATLICHAYARTLDA